jgi:hypothetical protein
MYETEVARGIRALDDDGPADWRERIDITMIQMTNSDRCVLGLVFGSYWSPNAEVFKERHSGASCGFYGPHECACDEHSEDASVVCGLMARYDKLTQEWRRQLALAPTAA